MLLGFLANAQTVDTSKVGEATRIVLSVSGDGAVGSRSLRESDFIYASETISAAVNSHGELILNDNSKIIVGENSTISLDDFVIGETGFKSGTLNIVKGAFRFITGNSAKGTFTVKTPLSTIGVRGTIFDVYVGEGKESVVLYQGAVQVCTASGFCRIASRHCDVIETRSSSEIEKAPFYGSAAASGQDRGFGLADDQGRFTKTWRAPLRACSARAAMESLSPGGRGTGGGTRTGQSTTSTSVGETPEDPGSEPESEPNAELGQQETQVDEPEPDAGQEQEPEAGLEEEPDVGQEPENNPDPVPDSDPFSGSTSFSVTPN